MIIRVADSRVSLTWLKVVRLIRTNTWRFIGSNSSCSTAAGARELNNTIKRRDRTFTIRPVRSGYYFGDGTEFSSTRRVWEYKLNNRS